MNGLDLFRKLGSGAKFNFNKYGADALRLKISTQRANVISKPTLPRKRKLEDMILIEKQDEKSFAHTPESSEKVGNSDISDGASDLSSNDENSDSKHMEHDRLPIYRDSDDEHNELCLVGNMMSSASHNEGSVRKKRKKVSNSANSTAALQQEKNRKLCMQIQHTRKQHGIHVFGTDVVAACETFEQMAAVYEMDKRLLANVVSAHYTSPTPIQMQAIPVMMQRREILACAPTGSGKTAAFLIPVLHELREHSKQGFRALVLAPTRELARQTYNECCRLSEGLNLRVHCIDKIKSTKLKAKSHQKFDILITTPNRLVFLLRQDPPVISLHCVQWLIVDESDKLFESGKRGFRDQLAEIYKACDGGNVCRAMFSATFTSDVEKWCTLNLDNVVQVYVGSRNAAVDTVDQKLVFVGSESGKLLALRDIFRKGVQPPVLIFVQSKERAKELFHELIYDGINVDVIHADRTKLQRDNTVRSFRLGKVWVLLCTELMGRGIDFKGISLVINYDFPNSAISYIHRIGRTGRAGRQGQAVTFFTEDDVVNLRSIASVMREAGCSVPDYMLHLRKPSRKERRYLAHTALPRPSIRTIPKQDINAARSRRKRTKLSAVPSASSTSMLS